MCFLSIYINISVILENQNKLTFVHKEGYDGDVIIKLSHSVRKQKQKMQQNMSC